MPRNNSMVEEVIYMKDMWKGFTGWTGLLSFTQTVWEEDRRHILLILQRLECRPLLESAVLSPHHYFRNNLIPRSEPRENSGQRERVTFQHLCVVHGTFTNIFLSLTEEAILVLYNDRSSVRVIRIFGNPSLDVSAGQSAGTINFPLLRIRHQNFVDIYELYLFGSQVFAFTKLVGFSLENLLQRPVRPLALIYSRCAPTK